MALKLYFFFLYFNIQFILVFKERKLTVTVKYGTGKWVNNMNLILFYLFFGCAMWLAGS